ncbi:glycoside hydrolase family 26 protein [Phytohabitans rumicis]|uniref:glycoside hydrolase family 26 protein n=1 Tax=Phytohabitans rumicis TaxID=1076125 RepID=UPI001566F91E|nr:glycosyl hydrolase [Phytohabitans rumicis]
MILSIAVVEYAALSRVNISKLLASVATSQSADPGPGTSGSPSPSPVTPYDVKHLLKPDKKFLGVAIDGAPTDMSKIEGFATRVGKKPNLIAIYESFDDAFAISEARKAYEYGALPVIRWEPFKPTLVDIAAGKQDHYILTFAESIRTLNLPVVLTFAHEMNGDWYSWGRQNNSPADFVAAWRHIHGLFARAAVKNVIWAWTPNVINPMPNVKLKPYYPGDQYVDWVGMDGYYTHKGKKTFDTLFEPTMKQIRAFTKRPFLIVETAAEPGSSRPAQIADLFEGIADRPDVLGLVWFNNDGSGKWNIDRDAASMRSFRDEAKSAAFGFRVA